MEGGKLECASNGKEKMCTAKKKGAIYSFFFIPSIMKGKPHRESLERGSVEADKDKKAGNEEKRKERG